MVGVGSLWVSDADRASLAVANAKGKRLTYRIPSATGAPETGIATS
jgi:hypothetical protein